MNYIKSLEQQLKDQQIIRQEISDYITNNLVYLQSSKFHVDTTIQTWEVREWLRKIYADLNQPTGGK